MTLTKVVLINISLLLVMKIMTEFTMSMAMVSMEIVSNNSTSNANDKVGLGMHDENP